MPHPAKDIQFNDDYYTYVKFENGSECIMSAHLLIVDNMGGPSVHAWKNGQSVMLLMLLPLWNRLRPHDRH